MSEQGEALFQRFVQHGFEGLVDDQPAALAKWLRERAAQTNQASLAFISDAINAAYGLFLKHDDYGGTRLGFIHQMDELVYSRLPAIRKADPRWATKLAKDFCDEVLAMVRQYDPQRDYD